jgi:hypothetical protein
MVRCPGESAARGKAVLPLRLMSDCRGGPVINHVTQFLAFALNSYELLIRRRASAFTGDCRSWIPVAL